MIGSGIAGRSWMQSRGNNGGSSIYYRHWNVFFKDIYRVSVDFVSKETGKVIQPSEILEHLTAENLSNLDELPDKQEKLVLKIHYQMQEGEQADEKPTQSEPRSRHKKHRVFTNRAGQVSSDFSITDGLTGLKMGRKNIVAKVKDIKIIDMICKQLQSKLK